MGVLNVTEFSRLGADSSGRVLKLYSEAWGLPNPMVWDWLCALRRPVTVLVAEVPDLIAKRSFRARRSQLG
jgi:hypothetical protein